jgi:TatD DNase family protein
MWTDTHAHLYDIDWPQLTPLLSAARQQGVKRIVNTAVNLHTAQRILEQAERFPQLCCCIGISPFDSLNLTPQWLQTLDHLLATNPSIIAIGEIGLDSTNPSYPPLSVQRPLLEAQLECAVRHDLPVVLHSRGCEEQLVELCRSAGVRRALFHCFTGAIKEMRTVLDNGYFVSFSGILTFKRAELDEQARFIPLDRVFIETDTPFLAPVPHRGKSNQPAWVSLVGEHLAKLKGIEPPQLAAALECNFQSLFCPAP